MASQQAEMLQNMLQTLAQGQLDMQKVIQTQAESQQRLDANLQSALSQLGEAKDVILQQQAELQALKAAQSSGAGLASSSASGSAKKATTTEEENFELPSSAVQRPAAWDGKAESWESFRSNFENWVGCLHSKYPELLREAAKAPEEDLAFDKYDAGKKNLTVKLFIVLKPLVDSGSGRAVVSGTTMQNGFYLWHKLVRDIRPDDKLKEVKWRKALQNPEFSRMRRNFRNVFKSGKHPSPHTRQNTRRASAVKTCMPHS